MKESSDQLGNSTEEQALLRKVALWAADCAEQALPVFEEQYPNDNRPRAAIEASREFGLGKKRDKNLRVLAMAAFKIAKDVDEPSKHVLHAASLAASVAYTHTDLQSGMQGIRQARHLLGPTVHAALALELAGGGDSRIGNNIIYSAAESAPSAVRQLLIRMPPQPEKSDNRLEILYHELDTQLRN